MKTANRGISGDTTRGMLIQLQEDVLDLNPSAVVMLMGTNDLADEASAEIIAGNVKLILDRLKNHKPGMPVVLCQVFPSSPEKQKKTAKDIQEINQHLAAVAKGDHRMTVVDTWTLFANEEGGTRIEEFPDLLHPNKIGYDEWAAVLRPIFATLRFLES